MSWITHPLLAAAGVDHGFGTRACAPPPALARPRQVHGTRVIVLTREASVSGGEGAGGQSAGEPRAAESRAGAHRAREHEAGEHRARGRGAGDRRAGDLGAFDLAAFDLGEADAVVSERPALPIGVVTADCLPLLLVTPSGRVAAVHAGWRGLAAGVIGEALSALAALAPEGIAGASAVIGPRVGSGCYEVDAPVAEALARRFAGAVDTALVATRPGHWQLDLATLACVDLVRAGVAADRVAALSDACTACDAERFHSYRRDGPRSGRLFHWIAARADPG